jgi:hypothetical protein
MIGGDSIIRGSGYPWESISPSLAVDHLFNSLIARPHCSQILVSPAKRTPTYEGGIVGGKLPDRLGDESTEA